MGDFADFDITIILEDRTETDKKIAKGVYYVDIPDDVSLEDAADGIQTLLDRVDLETWFNEKKLKRQS
ncbi:hypothetical protein J2755_000281 [Methanohalophilus levihalophilus]|uniref:hypothetical protein n=1 Tax=Methanohalophilus levihalophilus TaxID=1431282 RepID=UPI001AE11DF3|nr:hypothetical protein [Methanohalophilus levihalophilus]MBP2029361.1 hypothetical protein [Methanohalophilus levihalophilus]